MKRLFLMLGAAASVALPLGDLALAQGRGHGRGGEHAQGRGDHGRPDRERGERGSRRDAEGSRRGGRYDGPPPRNYGRGEPGRFDDAPRRRAYEDRDGRRDGPRDGDRRRYDDPEPRAFAPQSARRGGYLPDRFRGGVVEDYRRFRLRPPPHGYAWVRVGSGFALVSEDTGRVFDVIPD